jgi:hypothetical protein
MKNTVSVELKNENALNLLYDLEKMDILHIVRESEIEELNNVKKLDGVSVNNVVEKINIGERFAGVFSKEDSDSLKEHVILSREEWDNRI